MARSPSGAWALRPRDGQVRELLAFGSIVPTGLAAADRTLFMGQANKRIAQACPSTA